MQGKENSEVNLGEKQEITWKLLSYVDYMTFKIHPIFPTVAIIHKSETDFWNLI